MIEIKIDTINGGSQERPYGDHIYKAKITFEQSWLDMYENKKPCTTQLKEEQALLLFKMFVCPLSDKPMWSDPTLRNITACDNGFIVEAHSPYVD